MTLINEKKGRTNQKGQALVETALVLFLLLLLVLGIFEFGRAMYTKNTLVNAARAGARAAVVQAGLTDTDGATFADNCITCANSSSACQAVCNSLYAGIPKSEVAVDIDIFIGTTPTPRTGSTNPAQSNDTVKVTVKLTGFQTFTKFITITDELIGEASMRYEL